MTKETHPSQNETEQMHLTTMTVMVMSGRSENGARMKRQQRKMMMAAVACACFYGARKNVSVRTLRFLWFCCVCPEPVLLNQANKSDRGFVLRRVVCVLGCVVLAVLLAGTVTLPIALALRFAHNAIHSRALISDQIDYTIISDYDCYTMTSSGQPFN